MVEEADLGERIMRALILRRVGLLESGVGGPIIVGHADNADVLRLKASSRATAIRTACSIPTPIRCAKTLIERFHVDAARTADRAVPERAAAAQSRARASWRAASAWSRRSIRERSTTWRSSAPGRPDSPPRSMPRRKGCR